MFVQIHRPFITKNEHSCKLWTFGQMYHMEGDVGNGGGCVGAGQRVQGIHLFLPLYFAEN